jgi:hypothetical protein
MAAYMPPGIGQMRLTEACSLGRRVLHTIQGHAGLYLRTEWTTRDSGMWALQYEESELPLGCHRIWLACLDDSIGCGNWNPLPRDKQELCLILLVKFFRSWVWEDFNWRERGCWEESSKPGGKGSLCGKGWMPHLRQGELKTARCLAQGWTG